MPAPHRSPLPPHGGLSAAGIAAPGLREARASASATAQLPQPDLPRIRVLPATVLALELLVDRPALDLRAASRLVAADPGALLHLFALAAAECFEDEEAPLRLEDCIASVSSRRLLKRFAAAAAPRHQLGSLTTFARHAACVGDRARTVADSLELPREQANLIGILHDLGNLPATLGWPSTLPPHPAVTCARLCQRHAVPASIAAALDAIHRQSHGSVWVAVINAAHDLLPSVLTTS